MKLIKDIKILTKV